MFIIRQLTGQDFHTWWTLRKKALGDHPDAFGATLEVALATSDDDAFRRFADISIEGDNAIFGAFDDAGSLVGMTGFYRESGTKERHRAGVWGVYVDPIARGHNLGGRLLSDVVAYARSIAGILQLELTVASHNLAALAVYRQAGFESYGCHPRGLMIGDWAIDEDLMVLILDEPPSFVGTNP